MTLPKLLHGILIFEILRVQLNNKKKARELNNLENVGLTILKKNIF